MPLHYSNNYKFCFTATLRQNPYSLLWFWYSKECLIDAQALCYVNISSVATTTEEPTTTQEVTTTQEMTSTQQLTTTEEVITTIPTTQETTTSHTSDVTITGIEATTGELGISCACYLHKVFCFV